jgi:serine/threonine protein kinase
MGRPLDEKSDVYSFGIVLWEIVTRKEPFETMDSFKEFKRAICRDHERPELPRGLNPRLAALMTACWDRDPQRRPSFAKVLEELQELLIEIAVRDEVAARLWRTAFLGRDRLPWNEFLLGLARASTSQAPQLGALPSADSLLLRCLKALLAERVAGEVHLDQAEQVSCENWGKIIAWFGPLDTWTTFLERVRQALQQSWFHGAIEKQEAESLLSGQPEGAFLVRLSTSQPGCFTISKVSRSLKIQHQRIDYQAERNLFSIQIQSADGQLREATTTGSLEAFISEHARELNLKSPVPCSRFRFLFERSASEGYLLPVEDY